MAPVRVWLCLIMQWIEIFLTHGSFVLFQIKKASLCDASDSTANDAAQEQLKAQSKNEKMEVDQFIQKSLDAILPDEDSDSDTNSRG